jgi:t-SNARE complex subunit (syntaxin)
MSYYQNSARAKNPFGEEEEDSRNPFGNRAKNYNDHEDDLKQVHEKIGQVENDSLDSTRRALRSLNESREVGTKTAAELVRQGEKLQAIEENLDTVNSKLTDTQKNLNKIKSVFGGIKNKFVFTGSNSSSNAKSSKNADKLSGSKSMGDFNINSNNSAKPEFATITGSDREKELNKNLEEMSLGLKDLANLARDMNREMDRQNPMLERLNTKAPTIQGKIQDQNDQMERILK